MTGQQELANCQHRVARYPTTSHKPHFNAQKQSHADLELQRLDVAGHARRSG
jgi:hypothetical protein